MKDHPLRAGQLWRAPWPLCWTMLTCLGPGGKCLLLSSPFESGLVVNGAIGGRDSHDWDDLWQRFVRDKWTYLGRLQFVIGAWNGYAPPRPHDNAEDTIGREERTAILAAGIVEDRP